MGASASHSAAHSSTQLRLVHQCSTQMGDHETIANAELNLADISMHRGNLALARELLESVERLIVDPVNSGWMRWRYSLHWLASLADHALARGAWDEALAHAERCLVGATWTRSQKYVAKANRALAEIALARRQWAEAGAALRTALHVAESIHQPTQIWKTYVARARLARAQGDADAALQALQAAEHVVAALKSGVQDPELRGALHASIKVPHFTEVRDAASNSEG